jgi:hypothetical protein
LDEITGKHKIEVQNLERFRRVVCLLSLVFAGIGALIIVLDPQSCKFELEEGFCTNAAGEELEYVSDNEDDEITCTEPEYTQVNLIYGVWITAITNLSLFLILLLHYIRCGCLIKACGRGMVAFYSLLIGSMIWAQVIFFEGNGCGAKAFVLYYWLAFNIFLFYIFTAYGLQLYGGYLCWAQEEEEELVRNAFGGEDAMKKYITGAAEKAVADNEKKAA